MNRRDLRGGCRRWRGRGSVEAVRLDVAVFHHPPRVARVDGRRYREVVDRRRRRNRPFERARVPRVGRGAFAVGRTPCEVDEEKQEREPKNKGVNALELVPEIKAHVGSVGIDSPRHPEFANEMHREERRIICPRRYPEMPLAKRLIQHSTGDLRPIIVERRQDAHQYAAEKHIVEMGNDEVTIGLLEVDRGAGMHDAAEAADREFDEKAHSEQHRGGKPQAPAPYGRDPAKNLDAGRDRNEHRGYRERAVRHRSHAGREHVMAPHAVGQKRNQDQRVRHHRIAEQGLAREHRDYFRDHPEGRQGHNVDFGMAEYPEQVLPQDRGRTRDDLVVIGAEIAIHEQEDEADRQRGKGEQDQNDGHQQRPDKHGHPHEGHARRAHIDDGDEEVKRAHHGRDAQDEQSDVEEIDIRAGRIVARGQIGVPEPSCVRRTAEDPAEIQGYCAQDEDPVTQRIEARKGDVAGADLKRNQEIAEKARLQRHEHEEDHRQPMHRENFVVDRGRKQRVVRDDELGADEHRLNPAHHHEDERAHPVENGDTLVVDGGEPADDPTAFEIIGLFNMYRARLGSHW